MKAAEDYLEECFPIIMPHGDMIEWNGLPIVDKKDLIEAMQSYATQQVSIATAELQSELDRLKSLVPEWVSVGIKEPELGTDIIIWSLIINCSVEYFYNDKEDLKWFKYWMPKQILPPLPQSHKAE